MGRTEESAARPKGETEEMQELIRGSWGFKTRDVLSGIKKITGFKVTDR